jgi:hypothetical protein
VPGIDRYLGDWSIDRAASPEEQQMARELAAQGTVPIAIAISAQDIAKMTVEHYSPYMFSQNMLERFKAAGAPVEGTIKLKLAHGKIARVKPDPLQPQDFFQYLWLPDQYAEAIRTHGASLNC